MLDLQGPQLRPGTFANGPVILKEGDGLRLDLNQEKDADQTRAPKPHLEIFCAVEVGVNGRY